MQTLPKRIYTLDIARFIAAIAVVFYHWRHFSYQNTLLDTNFDSTAQPFYSSFKIFYLHSAEWLAFFFFLSGFVLFWLYEIQIKNKSISFKKFMVARFARLYPLHIITLFLLALLQYIYYIKTNAFFVYNYNDINHFTLNIFTASTWGLESGKSFNGPFWSVSIEVLMYVIFFILAQKKWENWLVCLMFSMFSFVFSYLFIIHPLFFGTTTFFLGGLLFYFINYFINNFTAIKYLIYFGSIICWILVFINLYILDISEYLLKLQYVRFSMVAAIPVYLILPITVSTLIFLEIDLVKQNHPIIKLLNKLSNLGHITYAIYLIHFPLQLIFMLAVVFGFLNPKFYLSEFWMLLFFVILLPIAHLTFKYYEMPMKRKFKNYFS